MRGVSCVAALRARRSGGKRRAPNSERVGRDRQKQADRDRQTEADRQRQTEPDPDGESGTERQRQTGRVRETEIETLTKHLPGNLQTGEVFTIV